MSTTTAMVKMSDKLKEHLATYAAANNMTLSEFVRDACAKATKYDLRAEEALEVRGRPRKYQTPEERKEARRIRARDAARQQSTVVKTVMREERLNNVAALENYLKRKGLLDEQGNFIEPAATAGVPE